MENNADMMALISKKEELRPIYTPWVDKRLKVDMVGMFYSISSRVV